MHTIIATIFLLINGYFAFPSPARNVTESDTLDRRSSFQHFITSRETLEVVWSCLATTISCTWIAIHPNMHFNRNPTWSEQILRRLYLMVLTLLTPEVMVTWAYRQYRASGEICRSIKAVISDPNRESLSYSISETTEK